METAGGKPRHPGGKGDKMLTTESALRKDRTNAQSKMEHRHFATVAAIIAGMTGEDFEGLRKTVARHFANELRHTNPKFDRDRFLKACGL